MRAWIRRALTVCAFAVASGAAHAAVIGFEGVGANNAQFTTYSEDGFTVTPGSMIWFNNRVYGAPAPSVQYWRYANDPELISGLFFTAGGADFTFASVDLYSSVTPIPYFIRGYQDDQVVYSFSGTVPNTFGQFRTVFNPEAARLFDKLYIQIVNPYLAFPGNNPVGMDNIVVSVASVVPEPASLGVAILALTLCAGFARSGSRTPSGSGARRFGLPSPARRKAS
jgi:hypothetical protein